jgi:N-acetylmuramoyl-L-alanine amidase
MSFVRILKDVPDSDLRELVDDFESEGATVETTRQPDGRWTVKATFPDRAGGASSPAGESRLEPATARSAAPAAGAERSIDVLARTLWGEARGEGRTGIDAVAAVVVNRLRRPRRFGATIEEICRKPFQFSCWNENDPNLPKLLAVGPDNRELAVCLEVAKAAVEGRLADPTGGADHYHHRSVQPAWSAGRTPSAIIGNHLFFNDIP